MMMKVMLMKIVVCVSDEVLNSQHYKHSQSTEASDQYANELILYLNELLNEDCSFLCFIALASLHDSLCVRGGQEGDKKLINNNNKEYNTQIL